MSRRKVQGGLDVEARCWLVQVIPCVRFCDGQSLASPGRWAVEDRRYPEDPVWSEVARRYVDYAEKAGTPELLTTLALGKVSSCPFPLSEIEELKRGDLRTEGFLLERHPEHRTRVPIDFRYLAFIASGVE